MKLKHTINFIKKHTVAIFVKVEKEEPKVCTFNEEYIKLFKHCRLIFHRLVEMWIRVVVMNWCYVFP